MKSSSRPTTLWLGSFFRCNRPYHLGLLRAITVPDNKVMEAVVFTRLHLELPLDNSSNNHYSQIIKYYQLKRAVVMLQLALFVYNL
ncbi:hypothetical protein [Capnocytophaga canimorsus]|uniref:hypothetical protein n=1 Tax=Capnocytophaga canimorsus TaxID=28188 RepID=UPI0037D664C2